MVTNVENITGTLVPKSTSAVPIFIKVGPKPSVPPSGKNIGRFIGTEVTSEWTPGGEELQYLDLAIQLDATDADGKHFVVKKSYKLMEKGNPFLRRDLRVWAGTDIMPDGGEFEVSTIIGKPVELVIENKWAGRRCTTVVKTLLHTVQPEEQVAA